MEKILFTSESVTSGHPDKVCDYISDSILDEALTQDKNSRVACEVSISKDTIFIFGEITTKAKLDYKEIAKKALREIGYSTKGSGFDVENCKIILGIQEQSADIAMGVNSSLDNNSTLGAGDQGIMFGYACNETENYMPYAIDMAHKLAKRLAEVRKNNVIPYLRPDGKVQVTVEYEESKPKRIETILISTQHNEKISQEELKKDITEKVIKAIVPSDMMDENTKIYVNPTGRFVIGGPLGDTGLTGRKIIVDTYGGYARHGGGAFSGKDASKVDRSAAYMLRHIAKNIVANGYANKCEIQISYAIGMKDPLSIYVNTFNTGSKTDAELAELIREKFDLTPNGIIEYLDLRKPIYTKTTNYGHFGKEDLAWEKIIKM